jgi:two-component system NarL family sensor kinase
LGSFATPDDAPLGLRTGPPGRTSSDDRATVGRARGDRDTGAAPSIVRAVGAFMATSLVALAVLAVLGLYAQKQIGTKEAIRLSSESARLAGRGIIGPLVTRGVFSGDPGALAQLDHAVRERVLDDEIVRIKVWRADGRILYSDRHELIGQRYALAADDVAAIGSNDVEGGVSDLAPAENRYERSFGKLVEMYLGVPTATGERVLVEAYQRFKGTSAGGPSVWRAFAPTLFGALALLWLIQAPIAWSMARRLQRGQQDRERLLIRAVEASDIERMRIAADLHDGVVQRLAGTAYTLAAASERLPNVPPEVMKESLDESTVSVRRAMQELRSLIVEIHPPNLETEGLSAALDDLVVPLASRGIAPTVDVGSDVDLAPDLERLVFRAAQEGIRNVVKHADATEVTVTVTRTDRVVTLVVDDNGRGVDDVARVRHQNEGHVGLTLLNDLVAEHGGALEIAPSPSGGTRLTLEVPLP